MPCGRCPCVCAKHTGPLVSKSANNRSWIASRWMGCNGRLQGLFLICFLNRCSRDSVCETQAADVFGSCGSRSAQSRNWCRMVHVWTATALNIESKPPPSPLLLHPRTLAGCCWMLALLVRRNGCFALGFLAWIDISSLRCGV